MLIGFENFYHTSYCFNRENCYQEHAAASRAANRDSWNSSMPDMYSWTYWLRSFLASI